MCGRARLSSDVSEIKLVFGIPPERPTPNFAPSWNVAPTDPVPIVHCDSKADERCLEVMRWGLIPYWAKDIKIGFSTFNARGEDDETKPGSREACRHGRCLVPLDNFYESKKTATGKQPYAIALADRRNGIAGVIERGDLQKRNPSHGGPRVRIHLPPLLCNILSNKNNSIAYISDHPPTIGPAMIL
jgi:putative SOS response-associated peptidase YedK